MTTLKPAAAVTAALVLIGLPAIGAAEVSRGALMASTCLACHGGASDTANLTIAPLNTGYPGSLMVSNMKAFRDGTRPSTMMQRHAAGYSDEEIQAIADYFDSQR